MPSCAQPLAINEPIQFRYLARGRTYIKLGLPKDTTYQVGCYGETFEPYTGFPKHHVTAYLNHVALRTTKIFVKTMTRSGLSLLPRPKELSDGTILAVDYRKLNRPIQL